MPYRVKVKYPKGIFEKFDLVVTPDIKTKKALDKFVKINKEQDRQTGVPYRYYIRKVRA